MLDGLTNNENKTQTHAVEETPKQSFMDKYARRIIIGASLAAVAAIGFAVAKTLSDHDIEIVDLTDMQ